jgi:hypothetical protein
VRRPQLVSASYDAGHWRALLHYVSDIVLVDGRASQCPPEAAETPLIYVMGGIIALVVSVVGASFILARGRARRGSQADLGQVSQSWITEHHTGKQRDWP